MKDALLELKQLRASLDEVKRAHTEPIAIVGMGCRLPGGASSPEAFWRLLRDGVDAIGEVPKDRWDAAAYYDADPDAPGRMATRFGGFLERVDEFDPAFFGISPREARSLDPQQRLLLEVTWEALELAGQSPTGLYGSSTGVFIGMSTFDYALHQVGGSVGDDDLRRIDGYVATGSTLSPAAGRLSYVLGLSGPSMVVDTACSSSLVAAHLAVASLRNRECDLALVGGVNVILRPEWNVNFTKAHMLAPDGRCKTFDASADGYTRGEGCGVVILQRLADAVAARRRIVAVIRSSAVNQDGASGGLTVPSGPSQEQVIRRALDGAGIQPGDVSYVEAHGTGTALGDPIEVAALGAVFGPGRSKDTPLRVGSVKTNIGHLEAAAGVAALIKVALSLQHREIPPHLHFTHGNPMIDWSGLPVAVPVQRTPWTPGDAPRRAGISSFGFTGTNAHLVVEEAPAEAPDVESDSPGRAERPLHVLALSARTPAALRQMAVAYERHLAERPDLTLHDVAYTANTGRTHFRHRLAVVSDSIAGTQGKLAAFSNRGAAPGVFAGESAERPRLVFLFTGQGSQYAGMGRQLFETQPLFRATLLRCDGILRRHLERPLLDVLYPRPGETSPLDDTAYTQPALFAVEYALAALWQSWGIEPDALMGHSVGEYVAACVAGTFSLEDGLYLVAERARLMQALPRAGLMAAAQTSEDRAAAAIAAHRADVSLAAVNAPNSVVMSGAKGAMSAVVAALAAEGVPTQALRVSHAFHSPLMEPMLDEFERVARRVAFAPPDREIVSNVTGRVAGSEIATPEYWVRHVREPVRFAGGMDALYGRGYRVFLEIGPGSTLLGLGRLCVPDAATAWLPSLSAGGDWARMLQSLAELYSRGASVDWTGVDRSGSRRPVELPTYPFQRQRYWIDIGRQSPIGTHPATAGSSAGDRETPHATADARPDDCLYAVEWRHRPRPDAAANPKTDGRWIILNDRRELGTRLARRLHERGARCTLVSAGDGVARLGGGHVRVDPGTPADFRDVWTTVSSGEPIRAVVDLRGLDAASPESPDGLDTSEAVERTLQVVQAVARAGRAGDTAIWCVTRGAVAAGGESSRTAIALAQAPLWGFGRSVATEHPELWGGLVDLDPNGDADSDAGALALDLLAGDEDQIAYRGDARYVPRLVRRSAPDTANLSLDPEGAYLVVGGLGALGLHAARWLVSRGARTLVLASRRGPDTPGARQAVSSLEAAGARAIVARADVSCERDVERLLAEIRANAAPLRGLVHAAGTDAPVPLIDMTPDDLRSMFASKLRGAWLLHDRTRDLGLDPVVFFSSVASVWGSPHRAHYAAANACLDALAHERRRLGLAALSVNWGPWRGGGMADDAALRELERTGHRGLEPARALRALDALSAGGDAQATVADLDWPRFRTAFEARRRRPLLADIDDTARDGAPVAGERADWIERLQRLPPAQRPAVLEDLLRAEVAAVLGFTAPEDVPIDQSVLDLGMDSLRAVELAVRLQRHLGLQGTIPFLDCPRVRDLSLHLLQRLALSGPAAGTAPRGTEAEAGAPPRAAGRETDGVARYAPEREREIFEFSRVAWPDRPEHLVESRWRWMFLGSAERRGVTPKIWLYREAGRVVAHHGAMPVELQAGSERLDAAWFADTMVLESHRATATGARLVIDSNGEFAVGLSLGQTAQMREIALRLGWTQVAPLHTFVLLLRPRPVLMGKVNPLVAGMAGLGLSARRDVRRLLAGPKDRHLDVRLVARFDARHDRLWEAVGHEYPCAVTRDASYLNWKYVDQPGQDFVRLEFVRHGAVAAVAVLVFADQGEIYRYRRAFIVDLVVPPSDSKLVLGVLEAIRERCAASSVDAILFHLIGRRLESLVESYGFMRREPTRFLLVSPQRTSDEARRLLLSPASWLITMGDSDIDRPWDVEGDRVQARTAART